MKTPLRLLLLWTLALAMGLTGCGGCGDDDDSADDDTDDDVTDDDADDDADDDTDDDADDDADDDTWDDDTGDDDTGDDDTGDDDTGDDDDTVDDDTVDECQDIQDPIETGSYTAIAYEYGDAGDPDKRTTTVSAFFNSPDPYVQFTRGISMSAVPLHAVGYYPDGPGPFPLVLIVHGNHTASQLSYPGYDYLTHHLATHGFIAFSVEEDFLNGGVWGEMDARGIVLLRHLQLFREWNETTGHTFEGKVDMNRIGLAGHSRGGEAVTVAWLYNTSLHNPGNPLFDFDFNITSLYAIAPVVDQIGSPTIVLRDVNYFIMHGSHDGDVSDFQGHICFDRALPVTEDAGGGKGLLFVQGANHGQWNTVWAPSGDPSGVQSATVPLMSAADQQKIGKLFLSAWFRMTLMDESCYRLMFTGDTAFSSYPNTPIIRSYELPERVFVNHHEEDSNIATGSLAGTTNSFTDFAVAAESTMQWGGPGNYPGDTRGLFTAWTGPAEYRIDLPGSPPASLNGMDTLALRVGQLMELADNYNTNGSSQDFSVKVVVGGVESAALSASDYRDLVSMARVYIQFTGSTSMSVLDTLRIPLADFNDGEPLDASEVEAVILDFDVTAKGAVGIDDVEFTVW